MANKQDFFISHASSDKAEYVEPLAQALKDRNVTYWLDNSAMAWGDRLATKINEGLRITRHVLVCLSRTFLERPWPEAEMSAAFSAAKGKKILPLILNDKERVLQHYPLIRGMVYREFSAGVDKIADELRSLSTTSSKEAQDLDFFQISIESVHEGKVSFLHAQRCASIQWLSDRARKAVGLKEELDTGGFQKFPIRWVLVDSEAEQAWSELSDRQREKLWAVVSHGDDVTMVSRGRDKLQDIGIASGIVFHLYAVPKTVRQSAEGGKPDRSGGGGGGGGPIGKRGPFGRPDVVYIYPPDDSTERY